MSSHRSLSAAARARLRGFNAMVWVIGVVMVGVLGAAAFDALPGGGPNADAYRYEPWTNPDPVLAEDEGGGVWSGPDNAVIRLDGLDPAVPLVVSELDDTYVGDITVTGPGGSSEVEGEYGDPPAFDAYTGLDEGQYIVVPGPEAELWIDGFSDERWRVRVSTAELDEESGTVSGFGDHAFIYRGEATTARVSTRGELSVTIQAIDVTGATEVFYERGRVDRSIAWDDADFVVFVVSTYESGWSIAFDEPAPSPEPSPTEPSPTDTAPTETGSDG